MSIRRRSSVLILTVLAGAVLAAPPSDSVTSVGGDTVVTSAADLGDTPAVDTPLNVKQRAVVKEGEAEIETGESADTAQPSDERSSGWKAPGWPPSSSFPPLLQLSIDTLRQCTAQNGDGGSDIDRNGRGSSNKPVLRAVGCTQAVLRDGQQTILGRLQHLQTALWQKVETLKDAVKDIRQEVDGGGKKGALDDIQRGVDDLVRWQRRQDTYLEDLKRDLLEELDAGKKGQGVALRKLTDILRETEQLNDDTSSLKKALDDILSGIDRNTGKLVDGQADLAKAFASIKDNINERLGNIEAEVAKLVSDNGGDGKDFKPALRELKAFISNSNSEVSAAMKSALADFAQENTRKQSEIIQKIAEKDSFLEKSVKDLKRNQEDLSSSLSKVSDDLKSDVRLLKNELLNEIRPQQSSLAEIKNRLDGLIVGDPSSVVKAVEENGAAIANVASEVDKLKENVGSVSSSQLMLKEQIAGLNRKMDRLFDKINSIGDGADRPKCRGNEVLIGSKCRRCARGYRGSSDSRCYRLVSEKKTFDQAKRSCEADRAYLAVVDESNRQLISDFASDRNDNQFWVGSSPSSTSPAIQESGEADNVNGAAKCNVAFFKNGEVNFRERPCNSRKRFACQSAFLQPIDE